MPSNYYRTLGVHTSATSQEIKVAYLELVKSVSIPAQRGDKNAEERHKEINAAYEVLKDTAKRREYDAILSAEAEKYQPPPAYTPPRQEAQPRQRAYFRQRRQRRAIRQPARKNRQAQEGAPPLKRQRRAFRKPPISHPWPSRLLDWAKGLSTSAYLIGCLLIVVLVGALYFGPGLLARWSATPVPFVYNQTELDARNRITNAGLQVGEVKRYPSGNVPKGHAIGTEPDFSATVKKGTVIDLLVSNGVTRVKVPNLRGMTYEQARKAIRVAGLSPGQHTFVNSPMRPGAVVNTTPRSGATVSAGAEVSFRLSLGPKGNG